MGKMWLGPKASLNAPNQAINADKPSASAEVATQPVATVQIVKQFIDRPVEIIKEVIVEVPVIKEIIVERIEQVPVFKEIIKEVIVEVPVEVIKEVEVIREVEKVIRIPVVEIRKEVPAWVRILFWFEIVKYAAAIAWFALK